MKSDVLFTVASTTPRRHARRLSVRLPVSTTASTGRRFCAKLVSAVEWVSAVVLPVGSRPMDPCSSVLYGSTTDVAFARNAPTRVFPVPTAGRCGSRFKETASLS